MIVTRQITNELKKANDFIHNKRDILENRLYNAINSLDKTTATANAVLIDMIDFILETLYINYVNNITSFEGGKTLVIFPNIERTIKQIIEVYVYEYGELKTSGNESYFLNIAESTLLPIIISTINNTD